MSIPKVIHYCWFGYGEMPELTKKCINSWKTHCPDYQITLWNEDNFDVNALPFTKEAYSAKKYAFVSDYARLFILYHYGGIYMDTDVEVTKNLDAFLNAEAFSGFETDVSVPTGIIGATAGLPIFEELLDYYTERHFLLDNGEMDLTTNVDIITNILSRYGLAKNGTYQTVDSFRLYPADYFCPKDPVSKKLKTTKNTHTIHHFDGSWIPEDKKAELAKYHRFTNLFGEKYGELLYQVYKSLQTQGFPSTVKKITSHLFR